MLASINPLGERSRNQHFGVTFAFYLVGSVAGGLAIGSLAGLAGAAAHALVDWSTTHAAAGAVVVCLVALVLDLHVAGLGVPTIRRQVNEDWLGEFRGWLYGVGFGFQLGLGVVTIVTSAAVYAALALAFLTASLPAGALVGGAFGLARALPMVGVARVHEPRELGRRLRRAQGWAGAARGVAAASLVVVAMAGIVAIAT